VEQGEAAYTFRERGRSPARAAVDLSQAELAVLREELVLEAAARVLNSIEEKDTVEPG
jgi:hypothetical protein